MKKSKNTIHPESDLNGKVFYGVVNTFYFEKAYGFIKGEDEREIFVHKRHIRAGGVLVLHPGQSVTYRKRRDEQGRVEACDVQISHPKDPDARKRGRILQYNDQKCYGFIIAYDGGSDIFFHVDQIRLDVSEVSDDGRSILQLFPGMFVEYDIIIQDDGKRRAIDVTGPNEQPLSLQREPTVHSVYNLVRKKERFGERHDRPFERFQEAAPPNVPTRNRDYKTPENPFKDRYKEQQYQRDENLRMKDAQRDWDRRRDHYERKREQYREHQGPLDGPQGYVDSRSGGYIEYATKDSYRGKGNSSKFDPQYLGERRSPPRQKEAARLHNSSPHRLQSTPSAASTMRDPRINEEPRQTGFYERAQAGYKPQIPTKPSAHVQQKRKLPDFSGENRLNPPKRRNFERRRWIQVSPQPFHVPVDDETTMTLKNVNDFDILFKFRTNDPNRVGVSRRVGVIPKHMKLRVQIQGRASGRGALYLVLLTTPMEIVGKPTVADMKKVWDKTPSSSVYQERIEVHMDVFSD